MRRIVLACLILAACGKEKTTEPVVKKNWTYTALTDQITQQVTYYTATNGQLELTCGAASKLLFWSLTTGGVTGNGQVGIAFDSQPGRYETWIEVPPSYAGLVRPGPNSASMAFMTEINTHQALKMTWTGFTSSGGTINLTLADPDNALGSVAVKCI